MAGDDKKKMTAVLDINPRSEMDDKVVKWIDTHPVLKKKLPNYTYKDTLELDARKWDEKKLKKGLEALVRYELQILAHRAMEIWKTVQKEGVKAEINAIKDLTKQYEKIGKEIDKKCSLALEELSSDKGDNKKSLRDGKSAFSKMKQADLAKAFAGPRQIVVDGFKLLSAQLTKAAGEDKASAAAYAAAAKKMEEADKDFNGNAKDIQSAVDYLLKTAKDMAGNDDADKELRDFGVKLQGEAGTLKEFLDDINEFENEIDGAINDVKQKSLDADGASKKATDFDKKKKLDGYAIKIKSIVDKLAADFTKVEKKLK
jgi:archaellum component FlaC